MADDDVYERVKAWRKLNPDKVAAQAQRYRARYPDRNAAARKRYYEKHLDKARNAAREHQRMRRNSDPEGERRRQAAFRARREQRLAEEAGRPRPAVCDLCRGNNGGIVFDHCHVGGHFRGWLCDRCNKVLGLVKDSPALLKRMARYLEQSNGKADHGAAQANPLEEIWSAE
jgi:hypothetical protein